MLLLTNTPANKTHRQSPARKYPLRGCSTTTIDRVLGNADACSRLLAEFDNLEDVGTLRKCNKQLLRIIDNHSHLWRTVQVAPARCLQSCLRQACVALLPVGCRD
jgi:hypothetical protein